MEARSFAKIKDQDLLRLAQLAREDREALFVNKPRWQPYSGRIIAVALCQDAALHYVDGRNGVKDFDVWTFYAAHAVGPFPYRRNGTRDFGPSKFGRAPDEKARLVGRKVDLLGPSIACAVGNDPVIERLPGMRFPYIG